jgi:hypothetical protein
VRWPGEDGEVSTEVELVGGGAQAQREGKEGDGGCGGGRRDPCLL